jgi:hypothetical protein
MVDLLSCLHEYVKPKVEVVDAEASEGEIADCVGRAIGGTRT